MTDTAASLGGAHRMPTHQATVADQRSHAAPAKHTRLGSFLVLNRFEMSVSDVDQVALPHEHIRIDNHHFGQGLAQFQGEDRPWEICRREVQN